MTRERLYPILDAPIPLPIEEMGKKEAKSYLDWFKKNRDRRICILASFLDLDEPGSIAEMKTVLFAACESLPKVAYKTPIDQAHIKALREEVDPRLIDTIPDSDLSAETMAYCYDMAALFGKLLQSSIPGADLTVQLGGKKNIDYGFIVIISPNHIPINPFRPCTVMAYRAIRGENVKHEMCELMKYYKLN